MTKQGRALLSGFPQLDLDTRQWGGGVLGPCVRSLRNEREYENVCQIRTLSSWYPRVCGLGFIA